MTGNGINQISFCRIHFSYQIIAQCQLSIRILAQTVDFFAQLACRRIHLRLFAPRTRGAASGLRQRVFDPLDSRSRDSVERIFTLCPRANWGETQGALPLDPAKGSSTLWTPVRAIGLVTLSCYVRVLIR